MSSPVPPSGSTPASSPFPAPAPSPAAREKAVDLLARHYAADRLSESELQARLDRVFRAGTDAELQAVLAELPVEPAPAAAPKQIRAVLSGQEQKLTGVVPRRLELKARFGYVELDLTRALLQEGVTEIDVHVLAGYAEIRLPPGVDVESEGQAILGYVAVKGPAPDPSPAPQPSVRVTGRVVAGYTECYRKSARPLPPGVRGWLERWRRAGEEG